MEKRGVDYKKIIGEAELNEKTIYKIIDEVTTNTFMGKFPKIDSPFIDYMNIFMGMLYHSWYFNNPDMMKYQYTYLFRYIQEFFDKIIDTGTFCCFTSSTKIQDHLQLTTLSTVLHDVSNYHQENVTGTSFLVCSDMVDELQT